MSEKKFRRIFTICIITILASVVFFGRIAEVYDYLLRVVAVISTIVMIWAGFKVDGTDDAFEKEMALSKEELVERNLQLISDIMHKSAELSEAREEARRLRTEIEIHSDQRNHNKCWMNDFRLHNALRQNKFPSLPDPQKITLAEMLWGCGVYCPEQYKKLTENEEQMVAEIKEVIKKYMY